MEQPKKKQRIEVGSIRASKKDSSRFYMRVSNDVVLKKGDNLFLEKPSDRVASVRHAVAQGWLNEDKGAELEESYSSTPDYVKYFVKLVRED